MNNVMFIFLIAFLLYWHWENFICHIEMCR